MGDTRYVSKFGNLRKFETLLRYYIHVTSTNEMVVPLTPGSSNLLNSFQCAGHSPSCPKTEVSGPVSFSLIKPPGHREENGIDLIKECHLRYNYWFY